MTTLPQPTKAWCIRLVCHFSERRLQYQVLKVHFLDFQFITKCEQQSWLQGESYHCYRTCHNPVIENSTLWIIVFNIKNRSFLCIIFPLSQIKQHNLSCFVSSYFNIFLNKFELFSLKPRLFKSPIGLTQPIIQLRILPFFEKHCKLGIHNRINQKQNKHKFLA